MGTIIFFVVCIFLVVVFVGLGIYFMLSKKPANFWAGEKMRPEAVSDIKKYNRANGIMWIVYGVLFLIPAFVSLITNELDAAYILVPLIFAGTPILIFIYVKIIRPKYVSKELL